MGALADIRTTLAADLAPLGVPVHPAWPASLTVPCVFLAPPLGGDYLVAGPTFGTYTVAVDCVILVGHAPAEESIVALELLIEAMLENTADWMLNGVDAPAPVTVIEGGGEYLGTVVRLSKPFQLQ